MSDRGPDDDCVTIFIGSLDHRYVHHVAVLLSAKFPQLGFRWSTGDTRALLAGPGSRALHLQWVDVVLRSRSAVGAANHAAKLVGLVTLARCRRIPVIWTIHNRIGKGHRRLRSDRVLRTILVLLSSQILLLTDSRALMRAELLPIARRRFDRRTSISSLPLFTGSHGPRCSREEARSLLGVATTRPVVAYLGGANQADASASLVDPEGRYILVTIDHAGEGAGLAVIGDRWQFRGRPDNETYGLLISASDAVVLADDRAVASMTLHAAVDLRRPVISPFCPAVAGLAAAGAAVELDGAPTPDLLAGALERCAQILDTSFDEYELAHSDERIVTTVAAAYRRAGLPLPAT